MIWGKTREFHVQPHFCEGLPPLYAAVLKTYCSLGMAGDATSPVALTNALARPLFGNLPIVESIE